MLTWQPQLRALTEGAERDDRPDAACLLKELYSSSMVAELAGARAAFQRAPEINESDHPKVVTE